MRCYVIVLLYCGVGLSQAEFRLPRVTPYPTDMKDSSIEELILGLGLLYESYAVTTQDGYILNLNRMVHPEKARENDKGIPVLFVHGLHMHADSWLMQDRPQNNIPIAHLLSGYDVWIGDQRGTIRSSKHVNISSDSAEFWDFSFHETGVYDLPAFIDFILQTTEHNKLAYGGLSMGGTFYYVLCSERPEYQGKLYGGMLFHPLGAAPDLRQMSSGVRLTLKSLDALMHVQRSLGVGPSLVNLRNYKKMVYELCMTTPFTLASSFISYMSGSGCFRNHNLCKQTALSLGGTSTRTMIHAIQLFKNGGKFTKYDWGPEENMRRYGRYVPPEYDVRKIRAFTAAYVSDTDEYTPTWAVVPFLNRFNCQLYVCKAPAACHFFTQYDPRISFYVVDTVQLMHSMTGRTSRYKMNSGLCHIRPPPPKKQSWWDWFENGVEGLLPGYIHLFLKKFVS